MLSAYWRGNKRRATWRKETGAEAPPVEPPVDAMEAGGGEESRSVLQGGKTHVVLGPPARARFFSLFLFIFNKMKKKEKKIKAQDLFFS